MIQIHQDIAGIAILGVRLKVHVAASRLRTRKKRSVAG